MSTGLAIAAVTAVLKDQLGNAVSPLTAILNVSVDVSAIAPDRISISDEMAPRLNLYLYGVTPNQGWRNSGLPSRNGNGVRLTNPPLALDLHYLLTAYGSDNYQAEVLFGRAMQSLHEVPQLARDTIRDILAATASETINLSQAGLADQIELVKISPEPMNTEDISKLWTAFQSTYRPTAAYRASVVLIQADQPTQTPLPVLTRGPADAGPVVTPGLIPPYPTFTECILQANQTAARLGESLRLRGHHLQGTGHALTFIHQRLGLDRELQPLAEDITSKEIRVSLPEDSSEWPVGIYLVYGTITQGTENRRTNTVPLALAPRIDSIVVATDNSTTTFTLTVTPEVWAEQSASLIVGSHEVSAESFTSEKTDTLTFTVEDLLPGVYRLRLRVDGIESILIDRSTSPPTFDETQQVPPSADIQL